MRGFRTKSILCPTLVYFAYIRFLYLLPEINIINEYLFISSEFDKKQT